MTGVIYTIFLAVGSEFHPMASAVLLLSVEMIVAVLKANRSQPGPGQAKAKAKALGAVLCAHPHSQHHMETWGSPKRREPALCPRGSASWPPALRSEATVTLTHLHTHLLPPKPPWASVTTAWPGSSAAAVKMASSQGRVKGSVDTGEAQDSLVTHLSAGPTRKGCT